MKQILKALVGSQAHGLAGPDSDYDYRGVFVHPTSELLAIGSKTQQTQWLEGGVDQTAWELGHYLFLASKCNPTILETLVSEQYTADEWGEELRGLFPYLWNSKGVHDAFCGYSHNQQVKFLDNKDGRANKYATAYLRVLYAAWELLNTGTFHLDITGTEIYETCKVIRSGGYSRGEILDICTGWRALVEEAYARNPGKETDMMPVNDFLLRVRKDYW